MRLARIRTPHDDGQRNCDRDTPSSCPQRSEPVHSNLSHAHSVTELVHEIVSTQSPASRIGSYPTCGGAPLSIFEFGSEDRLLWSFVIADDKPDFYESPGMRFDPPGAWVDAVVAVARDLRCLRYGRDVQPDRLVWDLSVGAEYAVTIGWTGTAGISGFSLCNGVAMDASFGEAAVWVADTAQTELAGYDFVQWPSRGRHLLRPRQVDGTPVWIDPHTDSVISRIGELSTSANW